MPYSIIVAALRPRAVPSDPNSPPDTRLRLKGGGKTDGVGAAPAAPRPPSPGYECLRAEGPGPSQAGSPTSSLVGREDERRNLLQLTALRAPERPRAAPRHGFAHRLALCGREVSEPTPTAPRAVPQPLHSPRGLRRGGTEPLLPVCSLLGAASSTAAGLAGGLR